MRTLFYFFACFLLLSTSVFSPSLYAKKSLKKMSFTISPLHLVGPIVEVTGEFRMEDKVGVAGILGIGSIDGISVFEVGGQLNYYVVGDFNHGMQLGGELMYVSLSDDVRTSNTSVSVAASGLGFSPYIGYKVAANFGLTFNAQVGATMLIARGTAVDNNSGNRASASGTGSGLMLNLNIGWSI